MLKATGIVKSRNEEAEGHSQVRMDVEFQVGDKAVKGQVILSSPGTDVVGAFRTGDKVTVSFE